ncbi:hypothetical protein NDU88_000365 [Pleurodeles waltl]|uniref:Uncharacterized protein n=1 Tax=Pleurodeles waltl TaxID=8319 RepID=A0AAV7N7W2_PLEWA|nr:hypothetical protein NDU88_000365 [Pleurodeles waltl]
MKNESQRYGRECAGEDGMEKDTKEEENEMAETGAETYDENNPDEEDGEEDKARLDSTEGGDADRMPKTP